MAKGNFIEYVISDDPNKYPNESEQDGYYYRKVTKVETEEQTVTAGTTLIEVIPSAGKLISKVNINPTPTESKSVTPTTSELTVTPSEGKYLSQVVVGAVEDVTPEVTAQTPVITQIAENLGVTITTPSGTNKQILQGNNANLQLISEYEPVFPTGITITTPPTKVDYSIDDTLDLSGMVITGTFDNGVVVDITDDCTFSPANGTILTTDDTAVTVSFLWSGKTYTTTQAISVASLKIVTWAGGTDEEIVAMVEAADQGAINLSDYWAVGDTRTIQLSAMSATGVDESHDAQEVDLVLMHAGGYTLNAAVASGRTTCSFIVGQKDSLATDGYINSSRAASSSWDDSARRTWCNEVYKNALPNTLLPIFKQFKTITAETYNGTTLKTSLDYFALPAAKEVFGGGTATSAGSSTTYYSNLTEFNALFQFDYYATESNRIKKLGKTGSADIWWERSPCYNDSTYFCLVNSTGSAGSKTGASGFGLSPFGCI